MRNQLIIFFLFFSIYSQVNAERKAFLVGIGNYPEVLGWKKIAGNNDIPYIMSALKHHSFSSSNITFLLDEEATKANIVNEFNLFISRCKLGDFVYVQFSGHGQQICDLNGDEIDQLDEAYVPYDSPLKSEVGDKLLTDDELDKLISKLRKRIGPKGHVLFVLDACHSGSGVRSNKSFRGGNPPLNADNCISNDNLENGYEIGLDLNSKNHGLLTALYACKPDELNYEYYDEHNNLFVGSFSYALSESLLKLRNIFDLEELSQRVKSRMTIYSKNQSPVFEGSLSSNLIQDGNLKNFNKIHSHVSSESIYAEIGSLAGIFEGSLFNVFNGIDDEFICESIASTTSISRTELSTIKFKIDDLRKTPIYVQLKEKAPPIYALNVHNKVVSDSKWHSLILMSNSSNNINFSGSANFELKNTKEGNLQLIDSDSTVIFELDFKSKKESLLELNQEINLINQINYLKALETDHSEIKFSIHLERKKPSGEFQKIKSFDKIKIGEKVQISVSNTGIKGAYFYLLIITPDNQIHNIEISSTQHIDQFLAAGKTIILGKQKNMTIGGPKGLDMIKIIASENPIKIESLLRFGQMRNDECESLINEFCLNYYYKVEN